MDTRNEGKFREPRGWALNWVMGEESAPARREERRYVAPGTREKFLEPRGWAMKWCGENLNERMSE